MLNSKSLSACRPRSALVSGETLLELDMGRPLNLLGRTSIRDSIQIQQFKSGIASSDQQMPFPKDQRLLMGKSGGRYLDILAPTCEL